MIIRYCCHAMESPRGGLLGICRQFNSPMLTDIITQKLISESCLIKFNLDRNYNFPIYFAKNGSLVLENDIFSVSKICQNQKRCVMVENVFNFLFYYLGMFEKT